MKRRLTKSKAPLSRRKVQDQGTGQDDSELNAGIGNDAVEVTRTSVSPKSKCYSKTRHVKRTRSAAASSSNDDQSQTSAFDYNTDEDTVKDTEAPLGVKRKRGSSKDEELTCLVTSRYKRSQQALNLIKKSDEKQKKNGKKRKGRKSKSSTSSDEEDFDQPVKKSTRFLVADIELVKFTSTTTQGRSKKALLNLKKNKRNVGKDDQHSEESNVDNSASESGTVDQKKYSSSLDDVDGDDERDDDREDDYDKKEDIHSTEHHNNRITRLENESERLEIESEQTRKENTVGDYSKSEIKCPVCSKVFYEFMEQELNEHVNSCLDSKDTSTTKTEIPENNPKSSLSILRDQLIAFEYQRKEVEGCQDEIGEENGLFFCQICQKDLSKMNSQRRQQHLNKCCDQMEKETEGEKVQEERKDDVKRNTLTCPFCTQEFKSRNSWQSHLKKCSQEHNVPVNQLLEIVKQQDQHQQEIESTSGQTEERTEARPSEDQKEKTGQTRKKRKVAQDLRDVDEETQLVMALSASMAPPPPPGNDKRKRKRKRKKDNEVIPALLLRSKEETQNVIAARAAQVVCTKDSDSDEEDISCTPALAPSSLAEQFLKVEQANAKQIVNQTANDKVTEETKGALTENPNNDKEELAVEGDSDTSNKLDATRFEDTTVILLSDMLASPDMCRSFLSFLDVPDEEASTTEIKTDQPATSVMVGGSATLWSMASLENTESSINDFYVPGLLPVSSPKQPKKTPRKSSNTSQWKVSAREETHEGLVRNTAKISEDICEDNDEGISGKNNKTMSESELTSTSQAANLDILLELVNSDCDDDDCDESQEPPRKSSVDHDQDDDEVFPSSGFCLPVGPNNQTDKADHSVPSSLSVFLQDMSKMVGNEMLSDVMIITMGDQSIPGHSFMLASRSEVLANMISEAQLVADGQQSTDKPVHLSFSDVEADAMRCILQYIYTASVNVPQSCIDDVIGVADRLELFELVKACHDSRTIHQDQKEKYGSEDEEEEVVRCSLSAEELLDAIWQDETADVEAKQNNKDESQDEWNKGFDDEDIEEVRIFQTQAVRKRTCSEDTLQEERLNLDDKNEEFETEVVETLNLTLTEGVNSDGKSLVMAESTQEHDFGKRDTHDRERDFGNRDTCDGQVRDLSGGDKSKLQSDECNKLNEKQKSPASDIQITDISYDVYDDNDKHGGGYDDDDDDQYHGLSPSLGGGSKVDLTEDDDSDKHGGGDDDDDDLCHGLSPILGGGSKVDLTEDDDSDKHGGGDDDDDDQCHGLSPGHVNNLDHHGGGSKVDLTEDDDCDKHGGGDNEDDDQNNGSSHENDTNQTSVKGKVDLTEDDDDEHEDDDNGGRDTTRLRDQTCSRPEDDEHKRIDENDDDDDDKGRETARVTDQTVSRLEGDKYKSIDEESDEHDQYRSIEDKSEEEEYVDGDIAILNHSISLLSDDNDCESSEKENVLVIPETPHQKKRHRSREDCQKHKRSSQSSKHKTPRLNYTPCDLSNEDEQDDMNENDNVNEDKNDNEKDHVSEDEEGFLERLKSRIDAKVKNAEKEKKKRKGKEQRKEKEKLSKNRSTNKDTANTCKELECSSTSKRSMSSHSPRVAKSKNDSRVVVDLSIDNEFEDLIPESASSHVESVIEDEDDNFEGNTSGKRNRRSDNDEAESCSSLSPPRMLSPRVPSPCYSDFDHEVPSPAASPDHSDVGGIKSTSYPDVNHSPVATTPVHRLSTDMHGERSPKDLQAEESTREKRVSRESHFHQEAIDSDQDSDNSDVVALLPVPTAYNGGETVVGENKTNKVAEADKDTNRTGCKTSFTGVTGAVNTKNSLFKRLGAAKYGLESNETEASGDAESDVSGLDDTPRRHPGNSQTKCQRSTSTPPVQDQNDFYDDGGFNCDVDDFGTCLDGDDSFMAHAAEQIELNEKQEKLVIKPDYQVGQGKPQTPAQIQSLAVVTPRNSRAQDTSADSPITPMPDYDNMTTPDLKDEVNRFGVRALPKKKMKAKLIEIYNYTHPGAAAQKQPEDNTSKTTKGPSLKQAKAPQRTAKPASKSLVSSSQPTMQPSKKKKNIPASQIRDSSDSDDDGYSSVRPASSQRSVSLKPSSYSTIKDTQGTFAANIEDGSSSTSYSSQPGFPASRRLGNDRIESTSSLSEEDRGTGRGSGESNNEDEEEFGEVSILIDKETDTASQQSTGDNLENKLLSFIESQHDVYLKVLTYRPIDLTALHELVKSSGIKCRLGQLIDFLDTQCITFTTAGQKPRQRRKPTRKKR